ncbi:hypothetical protein GCM10027447_20240 [Glycomyces halotolerans]
MGGHVEFAGVEPSGAVAAAGVGAQALPADVVDFESGVGGLDGAGLPPHDGGARAAALGGQSARLLRGEPVAGQDHDGDAAGQRSGRVGDPGAVGVDQGEAFQVDSGRGRGEGVDPGQADDRAPAAGLGGSGQQSPQQRGGAGLGGCEGRHRRESAVRQEGGDVGGDGQDVAWRRERGFGGGRALADGGGQIAREPQSVLGRQRGRGGVSGHGGAVHPL